MTALLKMSGMQVSCDDVNKGKFHRAAMKTLRDLASKMGLSKDQYDVRSNKGGHAVSGEITLHTDSVYVQICGSFSGNGMQVLYRTCKGRKDYSGGTNNFTALEALYSESFVEKLTKMSK